jgi:hypothetical protein
VIAKAVSKWITTRRGDDDWSADMEPLAALATTVAKALDAGDVSGPLVRELRMTLARLEPLEGAGDAFDLLAAELSAAVRDPSD